eukprot:TRINITY_DN18060_c0_g1_i1.p1 TRINITY_DN18060_c0_g1~~TRINITY_DN18060_c0_g1_i1.p1  ORF type:complete len:829 (+),score=218.41 TRINITY_DN18060_c0_g1_i1:131-2617(+)
MANPVTPRSLPRVVIDDGGVQTQYSSEDSARTPDTVLGEEGVASAERPSLKSMPTLSDQYAPGKSSRLVARVESTSSGAPRSSPSARNTNSTAVTFVGAVEGADSLTSLRPVQTQPPEDEPGRDDGRRRAKIMSPWFAVNAAKTLSKKAKKRLGFKQEEPIKSEKQMQDDASSRRSSGSLREESEEESRAGSKKRERSGNAHVKSSQAAAKMMWSFWTNGGETKPVVVTEKQKRIEDLKSRYPQWRMTFVYIATNKAFLILSGLIIFINACIMCYEVNLPPNEGEWIETSEVVFTVLFALDLFIRIAGTTLEAWYLSGWLVLDAWIVLASLIQVAMSVTSENSAAGELLQACQLLRMLRLLRLAKAFVFWRPLIVILQAVSKVWLNVLASVLFIGIQWLTFSIVITAVLGRKVKKLAERGELEEDVAEAITKFFGTVPRSFLTTLEITVGGVDWGSAILDPLWRSKTSWSTPVAVLLLICISYTSFCLWNFALGLYVRQVLKIATDYDKEIDRQAVLDGENNVNDIRAILEKLDITQDGLISHDELTKGIREHPEMLETMGVGKDELEVLHTALDSDGNGMVGVTEFLFAVLKLAGKSKTVDALSVDYNQKVFLTEISELHKTIMEELGGGSVKESEGDASSSMGLRKKKGPNAVLCKVVEASTQLRQDIQHMKGKLQSAKEDLLTEIAREDANLEATLLIARDEAALDEARRPARNEEARRCIEEQMHHMEEQAEEVARNRFFKAMCAGRTERDVANLAALHAVVRRKLDTQLAPWLENELVDLSAFAEAAAAPKAPSSPEAHRRSSKGRNGRRSRSVSPSASGTLK